MKIFIIQFFLFSAINAFAQKPDKAFPDKIQTKLTNRLTRVKGSKVFLWVPAGYKYIQQLSRYQKKDDLYLQVLESDTKSFTDAKPNLTRNAFAAKGAQVDVLQNIQLNQFSGEYIEGPSKVSGQTKLSLFFGDDTFLVAIIGAYRTGDEAAERELKSIIKSIYFDKALKLDPFELANFYVDKSITGFKFATSNANIYTFAENGKADADNSTANAFNMLTLPAISPEKGRGFASNLLAGYASKGFKLQNTTITQTQINGYTAFVSSTKITLNDNPGILYQVLFAGQNSSVLFMATAFTGVDTYLEKFKRTAASIRIK